MKSLFPFFFLLLVGLGCAGNRSANAPTSPAPQSGPLSDAEKKYLGAAGGYLKSVFEQDKKLASTMAGASTGQSTLGEIKRAVEKSQTVEEAAFFGDYHSSEVVAAYSSLDSDIQNIHRSHVAVFDEYLEYWKDKDTGHINIATARFKTALGEVDAALKKMTNIMNSKLAEKK